MRNTQGRWLRLAVLGIVTAGLLLPILAGLWETARAAFGILPAIGSDTLSFRPWGQLWSLPGFGTSLRLTIWTGFASTVVALLLATSFCAFAHGWMRPGRMARLMVPLLATPHAALAIGLAFLIAPSGWIVRLISPWATGWALPPEVATVHDPFGLALILGLLVKEVPFFLLVTMSALTQIQVNAHLAVGRALGYGRGLVWVKVIAPQIYPLIRLPIFVVLSFALSVVDMAIILGPSNPPTLAVAMTRWFFAADTTQILPASAAALVQTGVVAAGIGTWILAERLARFAGKHWIRRGGRGLPSGPGLRLAGAATGLLMGLGVLALVVLLVWSFAWRWQFPSALPESWSLGAWIQPAMGWGMALQQTLVIGLATTLLSLSLAVAWLEGEDRAGMRRARWAEGLIYLPLLVPQVAFLYGLSVTFLRMGINGGLVAVIWGQSLFVFPYVMIALSDPWRALDRRMIRAAAALGAGPARRLFRVKLPILIRPILIAAAIGFAVSVAQYLPTLFLGAGRVATLTTEAVTLSSGSDRRVTGVYAVLQAALPFAGYVIALMLPALFQRHRRELAGAGA